MDEIDVNGSILSDSSSEIYENPESQWWKKIEPSQRMHSAVEFDSSQLYRGESVESIVIEQRERVMVKKKVRYSIADDFTFSDVQSFRGDEPSMSFMDPPLGAIKANQKSEGRLSRCFDTGETSREASLRHPFEAESTERALSPKSSPFRVKSDKKDDAVFNAVVIYEASVQNRSKADTTDRTLSPKEGLVNVKPNEEDDAVSHAATSHNVSGRRIDQNSSNADSVERAPSLKMDPFKLKPVEEIDATHEAATSFESSGCKHLQGRSEVDSVEIALSPIRGLFKMKPNEEDFAVFDAAISCEASCREFIQDLSEADSIERAIRPKKGPFNFQPNEKDEAAFDAAISYDVSCSKFIREPSITDSIESAFTPKRSPFNIKQNEEDGKIFSQPTSMEEDESFHSPNRPSIRLDHEKSVKKRRTEDEIIRLSPLSCSSVTFTNLPSSTFIEEQMTPSARRNLRRLSNKENFQDHIPRPQLIQNIYQSTKSNSISTWSESISPSKKENSLNHENSSTDECRHSSKITLVFDIFKRVDFTKLKIEDPCIIARGEKRLCEHNVIEKENMRELLEIAHNKSKLAEFLGKTTVTLNSLTKPTINKVKADKNVNLEQAMGGEKFILEYKKSKLYTKESWITKHLYKFIQNSLEERYGPKALMKSEKFIIYLAQVINEVISENNVQENVKELKETMAKLNIIHTNHDFYQFCREYTPFYFQNMVLPSCSRDNEDIQSINRYDPIIDGQ